MTAPIPVVDLARRMARLSADLAAAVDRVAASGRLLFGEQLERFEQEWAAFVGMRHAVCVASGTDALALALRAVGVGEEADDEVIVPAFTAMPTLAAVLAAGGRPVPVDVDPHSACLDPGAAGAAVNARTRAVVPVHLYGRPCRLPPLGVPVVEDAAQAHGAFSSPTGSAATAYSFYPTKNLGGIGDGGAIVTDDPDLAARARALRRTGLDDRAGSAATGRASRMSELEAAALRAFLPLLSGDNDRRRTICARYRDAAPGLAWAAESPDHVYHLCVARERTRLSVPLSFAPAIHYPRASTQEPAYARFTREPCPIAEEWARTCVTVPCFPEMTECEVELVVEALARVEG